MQRAVVSAADVEVATKSLIYFDRALISFDSFEVPPAEVQYVPACSNAEGTRSVVVDLFRQPLRSPRQSRCASEINTG